MHDFQHDFQHQGLPNVGSAHFPSCALGLVVANVARAESAATAFVPAIVVGQQPCGSGPAIYGAAEFFKHIRQCCFNWEDELCAWKRHDTTSAASHECLPKPSEKEQRVFETFLNWTPGPSIVLCASPDTGKRSSRPKTAQERCLPGQNRPGTAGLSHPKQFRTRDEAFVTPKHAEIPDNKRFQYDIPVALSSH